MEAGVFVLQISKHIRITLLVLFGRASLMSPSHAIGRNCLSPSLTMIPMLDRVLYNFLHDEAKFKKSIFKKLFIFFNSKQLLHSRFYAWWCVEGIKHVTEMVTITATNRPVLAGICKHVAYYSPSNVHIYSLLAEQLCCSVVSLLL